MTDKPSSPPPDTPKRARPVLDDEHVRALLRHTPTEPPHLLRGVQRRIRDRSRGRFYADGWSRSRIATSTYVITSLLALAIFLWAYLAMSPALPTR